MVLSEIERRERGRRISREWRRNHPEVSRAWNAKHPEKDREYKKRFNARHPGYYHKYFEAHKNKRRKVLENFGGKCYVCRTSVARLELHHLNYSEGSEPARGGSWRKRYLEAAAHPERFRLLCRSDHLTIEHFKRDPTALTRLLEVYEMSKGDAQRI